jgi:vitamin B12 transporter
VSLRAPVGFAACLPVEIAMPPRSRVCDSFNGNQSMKLQLAPLTLALCASLSHASDTLAPVVITATRSAEALSQSLSASTVLDRAAIERSQARDAMELLRTVAGIDLARSGGPGAQTSLFLRGSNSNHVLVLIDGVRVASASTGGYSFELLPLEQIERIEIVRGPRASVWGSDAIGGVIQFFTRRDAGSVLAAAVGTQRDRHLSGAYGISDERDGYRVAVERRLTDGLSAQNRNGFSFNPDDDGLRRSTLSASGEYAINDRHRADGFALFSDSDIEFDQGQSRTDQRTAGFSIHSQWSSDWSQTAQFGYARENLATPAFVSEFNTERSNASIRQNFKLGAQSINLGLDWQRETGLNLSAGSTVFDRARRNLGVFALWQGRFARQSLDVSARFDDSSQFDSATTGSVAWGFQITPEMQLYSSIGQGFRAPNFNELYSPGFGGAFRGNPALDPERSLSYELGLKRGGLRISGFSNHIDDLIAFQGGNTFDAVNVREARIQGVELEHRWTQSSFSGGLNVTFQGPKDLRAKRDLQRRPKQKLSLVLDHALSDQLKLGGDVFVSGPRKDFAGTLPGYATLDLRAAYAISPQLDLQARFANVFDREYELARGFNTEARSVLVELRWRGM